MNQSFTRIQRAMAGVLALTFATVFVGDSLHLALFEHAHCAEHGELVHVHDDSVAHEHAHPHQMAHEHAHPHQDEQFETKVFESRSELDHEHCVLLLATQEDAIDATDSRVPQYANLEFNVQAWVRVEEPRAPQIALIRRAPKTAPPI